MFSHCLNLLSWWHFHSVPASSNSFTYTRFCYAAARTCRKLHIAALQEKWDAWILAALAVAVMMSQNRILEAWNDHFSSRSGEPRNFRALSAGSTYSAWGFGRCKNNKAHQLHKNVLSHLKYFLHIDYKRFNATILHCPHWNEWDSCATLSHLHPRQVLEKTRREIQLNVCVVLLKSCGCNALHLSPSVLWGERQGGGDTEDLRQHVAQLVEHLLWDTLSAQRRHKDSQD